MQNLESVTGDRLKHNNKMMFFTDNPLYSNET